MNIVVKYRRKGRIVTAREPNGQIQRQRSTAPSEAKRIRDDLAKRCRQPEYGTELGRLFLDDKITSEMFEAGKKWVIVSVQRSMALQSPSANPRSLNIGSGGESHPVDPDSPAGEREAKHHLKAIMTFEAAFKSIGVPSRLAIENVCDYGLAVSGYQQLLDLRCGLLILARHWGLDKSVSSNVR